MIGIVGGIPGSGYRGPILFVADFTALTPGAAASLPAGLSFSRAAGTAASETVQTGTSTVVTSGIGANVARIGRRLDADSLAYVHEESRINLFTRSRDISPGTGLTAGSGDTYTTGRTGPDGGTSAIRVQVTSGGFSKYFSPGISTGSWTSSEWVAQGLGTGAYRLITGPAGSTQAVQGTAGAAWTRISKTNTYAASNRYCIPQDGEALSGLAAGAKDADIDLVQQEAGLFATEAIITAGANATRAGDRLSHPTVQNLLSGGRIGMAFSLRPKGARADYSAAMRLWTVDASNYAEISTAGVLTVAIGGATNTTAAITWAQYDSLDLWVEAGASGATVVKYRVNSGAVTTPAITGSPLGAMTSTGTVDLLCNGTSNQLSAWVTRIEAYRAGARPAWAA